MYPKALSGATDATPPLGPDLATMLAHPNLGGLGALFAGRASVCTACQTSEPFDVRVDVTAALSALGLSPSEAQLRVIVEAAQPPAWLPLASTPLPPPVLRGAMSGGVRPRHDLLPDASATAAGAHDGGKAQFARGSTVRYAVEAAPGYLSRAQVVHEIALMFTQWSGPLASGLKFERVPLSRAAEAQVRRRAEVE